MLSLAMKTTGYSPLLASDLACILKPCHGVPSTVHNSVQLRDGSLPKNPIQNGRERERYRGRGGLERNKKGIIDR